jgi:hypothetical protein
MPLDEYDWLFDFILQFLESDKFDAAVMDFVDEKCEVFDNDDENKFIYTDIHYEFRDHLEILITSNLSELNVTMDMFLDAMEKGRNNRDINKLVFERLTAMDDFLTFKRMMVKRNVELQVEALRSYQSSEFGDSKSKFHEYEASDYDSKSQEAEDDSLPDPEELRIQKEREMDDMVAQEMFDDEEMQEILQSSLMEMELLRHREELEQADLEAALVLSLSLEEERIRLLRLEAKRETSDSSSAADVKESSRSKLLDSPSKQAASKASEDDAKSFAYSNTSSASRLAPVAARASSSNMNNLPDPKPLRMKDNLKPLPSISNLSAELEDRKKQAEDLLKSSAEHFQQCRQNEQELRAQILSSSKKMTDEQLEIEKRAKHMREQRDKILAAKKAEREKKVMEEEKRKQASGSDAVPAKIISALSAAAAQSSHADAKGSNTAVLITDENENQRGALRAALARRLKMDLLESEEQKLAKQQEDQFANLDRQLLQVEKLRRDNYEREMILKEQVKRQQYAIAKNVKASASKLQDDA